MEKANCLNPSADETEMCYAGKYMNEAIVIATRPLWFVLLRKHIARIIWSMNVILRYSENNKKFHWYWKLRRFREFCTRKKSYRHLGCRSAVILWRSGPSIFSISLIRIGSEFHELTTAVKKVFLSFKQYPICLKWHSFSSWRWVPVQF